MPEAQFLSKDTMASARSLTDWRKLYAHTGMNTFSSKLPCDAAIDNGGIVAHYLNGHHGHRLALCGVDLAGHDGRAGFVLGNADFAETVAGSGGKPADVVGYLHHVARERLYRAVSEYYLILRGEGVELVRRCNEGLARV